MPPSHAACSVASAVTSSTRTNSSPSGAQPMPMVVTSNGERPRRRRGRVFIVLSVEREAVGIDVVTFDMALLVLRHVDFLRAGQTETNIGREKAWSPDTLQHGAVAPQHGHVTLACDGDVKFAVRVEC